MDRITVEKKIRSFFVDDMMKEHVASLGLDEPIDLDSLDQTELRVFMEEEFKVNLARDDMSRAFRTLGSMVDAVLAVAEV